MKMIINSIILLSVLVLVLVMSLSVNFIGDLFLPSLPDYKFPNNWREAKINPNAKIDHIHINVPEPIINSYRVELTKTKLHKSLLNSNFKYGFNSAELDKMLKYWQNEYNWREWEKKLNVMNHFFVPVKGMNMHVIHMKPELKNKKIKSTPILLLHGWPGSFFEFYKVMPLLLEANFEVIVPSLPGYGWSESAERPGMDTVAIADVLFHLVDKMNVSWRDGDKKFYVQGGDWGSFIASNMARLRPNRIAGIHLNMFHAPMHDLRYWVKTAIGAILPSSVHFLSEEEQQMVYPYLEKVTNLFDMMGYFMLQSTRPDTVGVALLNSPAGLAAYIGEKFASWSSNYSHHLSSSDGGFSGPSRITRDEILTNVMIYYITGSITTSMRLYRETKLADNTIAKIPIYVPTGLALFPNEIMATPESLAQLTYRDIRQFTVMPRGGHFAALEEPHLLVKDILSFVATVENTEN